MPNNDRRRKNWNYQIENSHDYWFVVMMNGKTLYTIDAKGNRRDDNEPEENKTPWIDIAIKEHNSGVAEIEGDDANNPRIIEYLKDAGVSDPYLKDETGWCAAFTHWSFGQAGIEGAGASPSSWKTWGQGLSGPAYGALAVFTTSHVGFVVGQKGDNLIILHGNWSNKVSLSDYISPNKISCYRYPSGYKPAKFP